MIPTYLTHLNVQELQQVVFDNENSLNELKKQPLLRCIP